MREWMKSIPEKLKEHQEVIDKATQDYDLIEEFYYNLSQDEFNTKYVTHSTNISLLSFYVCCLTMMSPYFNS